MKKYHNELIHLEENTYYELYDESSYIYWYDANSFAQWIKIKLKELINLIEHNQIYHLSKEVSCALEYINHNYRCPTLTAEDIAHSVGMSINGLNLLFKKEINDTVWKRLNHIRLINAKDLINENNIKIGEIYKMVGFNSFSYFSTAFKKKYGCSPHEYRKSNENQKVQI